MKKLISFLCILIMFCGIALHAQTVPAAASGTETATVASQAGTTIPTVDASSLKTTLPPLEKLTDAEIPQQTKNNLFTRFADSCKTNFVSKGRWMYLTTGLGITVQVTIGAGILGLIIGFIVAVIRSIHDQTGNLKILNLICRIYLTVFRGTPVVVQLLFIYFVIFGSHDIDKVVVAIVAFGVNSGAYVTEIIRSGINSIDPGQMEAGRSLGLTYLQTMRYIILPQALKNVLPALGNEFISLLKETSIAGYIALQDLTKGGDIIRSQTYDAFLPLSAVALIYLAIVMLFTWLLGKQERKLKKNER